MTSFSSIPLPIAHPDYERLSRVAAFLEQPNRFGERLTREYPFLFDEIITQTLDPTRTGRTSFEQLSSEEKANLGSMIEAKIRNQLGVPKGKRDLVILDEDVDVKNTTKRTWMVPQETWKVMPDEVPGILLLSQYSPLERTCSLGLIVARTAHLTVGQNNDNKVSVSAHGFANIWWLLRNNTLPPDVWHGINVDRFRELRQTESGKQRAATFFLEHLNVPVERAIVQSLLFDQQDYMKRLRKNQGARDILDPLGIVLRKSDQLYRSADGGKRWYSFWTAEERHPATPPLRREPVPQEPVRSA